MRLTAIREIIDRLEMRRASVEGLTCLWCPHCLHVVTKDPKAKGLYVVSLGGDGCKLRIKSGTISEAIADLQTILSSK